ncbi:MAG: DUF3500 domain-containing protein, partial [Pyrinomonadaceae bacterium]
HDKHSNHEHSHHHSMSRRDLLRISVQAGLLAFLPPDSKLVSPSESRALATHHEATISAMQLAATAFYESLNNEQRDKTQISFGDEERFDWHYVPKSRRGIPLKELDERQRRSALALLATGLSKEGTAKATSIMSLENILREIEQGSGPVRDPELYYFTLFRKQGFGRNDEKEMWGWRVEGHHLSLNYTIATNQFSHQFSSTPAFFGSNPAEVRSGPRTGLRILANEEDQARKLLKSLDAAQREKAIVSKEAPSDILSRNSRRASPVAQAGILAGEFSDQQMEIFITLLSAYTHNMPASVSAIRINRMRGSGMKNVSFAWAGGMEHGSPHYYRVQGPSFLIEYDNTQNQANHIHSVWRDFNGDFGEDLLGAHYKESHHK